MEYFSNFGSPLYEGFQDDIPYDQVDAEVLKFYKNGNLLVKITLPKDDDDSDNDNDNVSKEVKLSPQKDKENMTKLEDLQLEFNKHAPINDDGEKDTSILEAPKNELQKIILDEEDNIVVPINFKSDFKKEKKIKTKSVKYILKQDVIIENESVTEAVNSDKFTNYKESFQDDDDKKDEDEEDEEDKEDEEDEEDKHTHQVNSHKHKSSDIEEEEEEEEEEEDGEIEGFVGNSNNSNTFNLRLLLKSLLFSCLFYLIAHNDTRKVLLKMVKIGKENYLYLGTFLFFVCYLILNILV